ncbi:uncharacterized protein SCHCODRAFT_02686312 [Schizophyllum commune H4-8]|uniref:uncharacterized protein n=1 Tax=Schizophyllum commune (strain H4-8 / FGSC 9210) TaxID=578458 RepID=UPI00215F793D|nr:uncharacterized protein SCHCODRAFT_02686312 [Schizophyllum commune H4-8]KAI5894770.1 hypothetical protein SCHCODRAFT_02686312 [Schizophyllum commune H4-8]
MILYQIRAAAHNMWLAVNFSATLSSYRNLSSACYMDGYPPPNLGDEEPFEEVDLRGGYPIDDEQMFNLADLAATHSIALGFQAHPPRDKNDVGRMALLVNDLFEEYMDIQCACVGNARDPREWSWFLATSPGRTVDLPRAEYDKLIETQDFWNPPAKYNLQETSADREVKRTLEAKGIHVRPFHTVYWG